MKRTLSLLIMFLLVLSPFTAFAGSLGKGDPEGTPGQWYLGSTPSYVDPAKSPIVFVHGLNSSATTWWVDNDMYDIAYNNGYETAFIDLYPTENMWDNGQLLALKLQDIYNHFGEKVVVVAHSKGGIDTQSALVHYGAYPYVHRVVTLSSPHHGSQLADLAYSSWAGWLGDILGGKNNATYSLQTGYMATFRSQTDNHYNVNRVPFYTFGGTGWGSFGSSLYWGGLYLSSYGSNDGAVTVQSSRLPYATEIAVRDWNHSEIREGSSTFNYFESFLYEAGLNSLTSNISEVSNDTSVSTYYRGGSYSNNTKEVFDVEDKVSEITIDWMSDQKDTSLKLVAPDGKIYSTFSIEEDSSTVFAGAYHHSIQIPNPTPGEWKVEAQSKKENYLLSVNFKDGLNHNLDVSINELLDVTVQSNSNAIEKVKNTISVDYYKNGKLTSKKVKLSNKNGQPKVSIPHLGEGIYNLTVDIEGKSAKGTSFNRTFVKSVYIDKDGNIIE